MCKKKKTTSETEPCHSSYFEKVHTNSSLLARSDPSLQMNEEKWKTCHYAGTIVIYSVTKC